MTPVKCGSKLLHFTEIPFHEMRASIGHTEDYLNEGLRISGRLSFSGR